MHALSYEDKKFKIKEPFSGLFTQGMVCHETYKDKYNNWISPDELVTKNGKKFLKIDEAHEVKVGPSESMSKSKKNTIDPENIIENYGADSVRLFILSDSPPEKDVQWSDEGMQSSYKFLQKLWSLNLIIEKKINEENSDNFDNSLDKITNQFISNVTDNIDKFSYNKIIANLHELYSGLIKILKNNYNKETIISNYKKILITMSPVIPHFANESLEILGIKEKLLWPNIDTNILEEREIKIVVQINGKTRDVLDLEKDIDEDTLFKKIKGNEKLNKYLKGKDIKKKIFIKNKLINIITN